jgi:gamma-glutamyltranspeptidase/glutathione hydrolase
MLLAGGNAVDAAAAMAAAIGVVEPFESNLIGGESYILLWKEKEKRLIAVEAVGRAPARASLQRFQAVGGIPYYGPLSVITPRSFDGWALLLADHGKLRLSETLAPAIELAEKGFPVSLRLNRLMALFQSELQKWPRSAQVFLRNGKPYPVGALLVQGQFAQTLKQLSDTDRVESTRISGLRAARDLICAGELGQRVCRFLEGINGLISIDDLCGYEASYIQAIESEYRDVQVFTVPPPSQGLALLEALRILNGFTLDKLRVDSPETLHFSIESLKIAYEDRERFVADPEFVYVPVEELLSKERADAQRGRIDVDRCLAWPFENKSFSDSSTTILTVGDAEGNLLIATTSIGRLGLVAGDTGIVLNNRMRMFHEQSTHPNCVAPRKRVRITLNPAMVFKEGRPFFAVGSPGADVQSQAQLQAIIGIVDFGLDPQQVAEHPRWVSTAFPDTSVPHAIAGKLRLEAGFGQTLRAALEAKGHVVEIGPTQGMLTVLQALPQGGWAAGADPRGETYAIGW